MKILKQLNEHEFVISFEDEKRTVGAERVVIAHDYLRIFGHDTASTETRGEKISLYGPHAYCNNCISFDSQVTIHIKTAQKIFLPYIQAHKYMQPEHLKDRQYSEDDQYYAQYDLTEPRYKKGDSYPAYSGTNEILEYWEEGTLMVSFSLRGEKEYSKVTKKVFDEYILPTLLKNKND